MTQVAQSDGGGGGGGACGAAAPRARFNPTGEDYAEFGRRARGINRLMLRRTMTRGARAGVGALGVLALLSLSVLLASSSYLALTTNLVWGVGAIFAGGILWAVAASQLGGGAARRARKEFEKDPRRGDEVVAEADDESFRYWSKWVRYVIGWEAVAGVYTTRDTLFVFDRDRLTYVIPRRGFGSVEESERFAKWVEGHAAFNP
jgi:hypothetical protein